jgi:hypothetical protein
MTLYQNWDSSNKIYSYKNYIFVIKREKYEDLISIYIGQKSKICLSATLSYKESDEENKRINSKATLQTLHFYDNCSIGKPMERVEGIKAIVKVFLKYLKKEFKDVKKVYLTNEATFNCDKYTEITLSKLYFFKYANFYYRKRFKFEFENIKTKKIFLKKKKQYLKNNKIDNMFLKKLKNIYMLIPK